MTISNLVHPCCCTWHYFLLLWMSNIPLYICIISLSISLLMDVQVASMSYCKQCCNEHQNAYIFFSYAFLKCKKAKWLSEEALQIAVKGREVKGKGEKERYSHLNAEFQRIARRDKKAFLSDQCKEIEENNRMGKTRDLLRKIRDTKGTFMQRWAQ